MDGDTRWLTPDERSAWLSFVATVSLLEAALDRQLQRDAGMPHAYYQILAMLSEVPGRTLRMTDLAAITQSSQSRLSHAVSRLERNGWVRRRPCPDDRRSTLAELTEAGFAALAAAAPGHVRSVRENLFDQLDPEQVGQLRDICQAALRRLTAAPDAVVLPGACEAAPDAEATAG
ncbi:MarR family winged helix-turn-helix transcriptional regulator [Pseudonocardia bannensis]|uniref:Winged helix-turn-helix transcriptional regulator n=1 Tax=Pseudonocardia bannensis TaxID=630973 RepID=A0A848DSW8_9PSEU|nr:MarR family winged helix-turn-helix transcriptional regulator [Pseudonocardia bannensis]NMH95461.1 winged helix-turn-helix transcriptional regulator [Pseudonocardia bannensis]